MNDVEVTMVPKDLYYHEVAYVRGLEKKNAELVAALNDIVDNENVPTKSTSVGHLVSIARAALKAAGEK